MDGFLALLDPQKLLKEGFLSTLQQQQQTKKMETSLCFLAGVLLLGGFLDTASTDDASTDSFLTSANVTTATTAEPVTRQHKTDPPTPTTAPSKSADTSGRAKQQDSTEESSKEENREDEKTQLGKENFTLSPGDSWKSDLTQMETLIKASRTRVSIFKWVLEPLAAQLCCVLDIIESFCFHIQEDLGVSFHASYHGSLLLQEHQCLL